MNSLIFGMVASAIKGLVKNPKKKQQMRNLCLDIFLALKSAYADDDDFQ